MGFKAKLILKIKNVQEKINRTHSAEEAEKTLAAAVSKDQSLYFKLLSS